MEYFVFSVYDRKAGLYYNPFLCVNESVGRREFIERYKDSPFRSDFQLYLVGKFDSESGIIFSESKPQFIIDYPDEV